MKGYEAGGRGREPRREEGDPKEGGRCEGGGGAGGGRGGGGAPRKTETVISDCARDV